MTPLNCTLTRWLKRELLCYSIFTTIKILKRAEPACPEIGGRWGSDVPKKGGRATPTRARRVTNQQRPASRRDEAPRGRRQARSQLGLPWTAPQAEQGQGTGLSVPTLLPRSQRLCPGDSAVGHGQRQRRVMMATAAPDAGHSLAGRRLTKLGCLACKAGRRRCRHATAGGPWAPGQAQRVGGDATARRLGQSREAGTTAAAL